MLLSGHSVNEQKPRSKESKTILLSLPCISEQCVHKVNQIFWSLLIGLESLELFYVNLLIKTYLLVPNLCLYALAFKNYCHNEVKIWVNF